MVGDDEDVRFIAQATPVQFVQHSRQIIVRTFERRQSGFGSGTEVVLRKVRLAQPKHGEFGHTLLPKRSHQRARRPFVTQGVRPGVGIFRVRPDFPNQLVPDVGGERLIGIENFSESGMFISFFAVVEEGDRFGASDRRRVTGALQYFSDSRQSQITPPGQPISRPHGIARFRAHGFSEVDARTVFLVGHDAAVRGIRPGGK